MFPEPGEIEAYIAAKHPDEGIAQFAEMEKAIRDKYLLCVPGFGSYVRTKDMEEYEREINTLKEFAKTVGKNIREALSATIDKAINGLYDLLEQQWSKSHDPWFEEFRKKNPDDNRDRRMVFVTKMKTGAKGTDELVASFVPEVRSFSTPIDEKLAGDGAFLTALRKILHKRNVANGVEKIYVEDLIAIAPKAMEENQ